MFKSLFVPLPLSEILMEKFKILKLMKTAEVSPLWWRTVQEDFYMEVMRHNQEDENR
jgi:hypothetical protein